MISYIVRSSIGSLGLVRGFVGLGIIKISFSARLAFRWVRRVKS